MLGISIQQQCAMHAAAEPHHATFMQAQTRKVNKMFMSQSAFHQCHKLLTGIAVFTASLQSTYLRSTHDCRSTQGKAEVASHLTHCHTVGHSVPFGIGGKKIFSDNKIKGVTSAFPILQ